MLLVCSYTFLKLCIEIHYSTENSEILTVTVWPLNLLLTLPIPSGISNWQPRKGQKILLSIDHGKFLSYWCLQSQQSTKVHLCTWFNDSAHGLYILLRFNIPKCGTSSISILYKESVLHTAICGDAHQRSVWLGRVSSSANPVARTPFYELFMRNPGGK